MEKQCRAAQDTYDLRIACWIPKAINSHAEYIILMFSTAAMVVRSRLGVTIYLNCLSCSSSTRLFRLHRIFRCRVWQIYSVLVIFCFGFLFPVFCIQSVDFYRLLNSQITNRTCTTLDRYVNKYNLFTKLKFL